MQECPAFADVESVHSAFDRNDSREYLDRPFFWNTADLERKLDAFRQYYNQQRVPQSLNGLTPDSVVSDVQIRTARPITILGVHTAIRVIRL